jgi:hypothetical protein
MMNQSQAKNRMTFDFSIVGMEQTVAGLGIAQLLGLLLRGLKPDTDRC